MKLLICATAIITIALSSVQFANAQGTFVPSQSATVKAKTPEESVGGLDGRTGFKKISTRNHITKWTQTVDGIPVYGSVFTTHCDGEGTIQNMQGFVSHTASMVDTRAKIDEKEALKVVRGKWNHTDAEGDLHFRIDKSELEIMETGDGFDRLIWKVSYFVDRKNFAAKKDSSVRLPAYIKGLVCAQSGEILRSWDNIQFLKVRAIVGNKNIGKEFHDIEVEEAGRHDCRHRDASKRIEVFDNWNRRYESSFATSEFECDDADDENWDLFKRTGAYSPRNEAYLHATQFVDMWKELMGDSVQPYKSSTSYLKLFTHYDRRMENAFFDGESFKFGDGKNVFYPLTSLDVVCHEIGHAITEWHGGALEYVRQSGGMNEAYSDILGETCDIHYKKRTDGLIGTDIMKPGNPLGTAMRDLCNPSNIHGSIDHMNKYRDSMDVHQTSGIYNKAWCTLKNTSKWNYIKAFEVFTDANLMYWGKTTTMHCGACGVESAAKDRGYNVDDVTAAFKTVGVQCRACRAL